MKIKMKVWRPVKRESSALEDPTKPLCKSVYELMTWNEAKLEGF